MKVFLKQIVYLSLFITISFLSTAHAEQPLPAAILKVMQQPRYQNAQWWLLLKDIDTNQVIYSLNANHMLMPASTTKMFTTAAALNELGYDFRFKTPVYFIGSQEGNTLNGSLILVGSGDIELGGRVKNDEILYGYIDHIYANQLPGADLVSVNPLNGLHDLARQIAAQGIKKIKGDVLVDTRAFQEMVKRDYTLSPVMINENLVDVQIKPGEEGQPAKIHWRPEVKGYHMVNEVKTVEKNGETNVEVTTNEANDTYYVTGTIAADSPEILRTGSITRPAKFARAAFIQALNQAGIEVNITHSTDTLPDEKAYVSLHPAAVYVSPPFSQYVRLILKTSHNIGADMIPLILAAHQHQKTYDQGMIYIAKFLKDEVKLNENLFLFVDGAGDDSNRIAPQAALDLLTYMRAHHSKNEYELFYNALPILGVDGSIAKNNVNSPAKGHVFAKTGTAITYDVANQRFYSLSEALSGYIMANNKQTLAFIIAVSNTPMESIDDAFIIQRDVSQVSSFLYDSIRG